MNESLLGVLVWAVFGTLVLGVNFLLKFFFPALSAWSPFVAFFLVLVAWLAMSVVAMIVANRSQP